MADVAVGSDGNSLLCHVVGSGRMGRAFRDIPGADTGDGDGDLDFFLWVACFVLTYTFPILNEVVGASGTFWLYGIICLSGFLFIRAKLPETKGKTLEELEKELTK